MRYGDWPARFGDFIERAAKRPFVWGSHDCCLFAADAVREMTGTDYAAEFRHLYATEQAAYELLQSYGYDSLHAVVTAKLGDPKDIAMASRGDVVLARFKDRETIGMCLGMTSAFLKEDGGYLTLPTLKCESSWSVD